MSRVGHCLGAADSGVNPARIAVEMEESLPTSAGFLEAGLVATGKGFPGASIKTSD
jgi:hypothetical protein